MLRILTSASTSTRLAAARQFVLEASPATETLVVSATRGAADDFARDLSRARSGATFGLYRFSLTQLAARLATPLLARDRVTPTTALGMQAVAARALFDARTDGNLTYFAPVASMPGFPRALARTLDDLALAGVSPAAIRPLAPVGGDLANLFERLEEQLESAGGVNRAAFLRTAARAVTENSDQFSRCRLVLLDVPVTNQTERDLIAALATRATDAFATVPDGDTRTKSVFDALAAPKGGAASSPEAADAGLGRIRRYLFAESAPPPGEPLEDVELFSAPGEGREAVEIARRILKEARCGVPFDRMAIVLRSPQQYVGLLEHALERAGVPAYFERGTRRPHPAGRAFLAILACALDNLSARRFAEYLSLGQVPAFAGFARIGVASRESGHAAARSENDERRRTPISDDEVFGPLADRDTTNGADLETHDQRDDTNEDQQRSLRSPWRWERLLAESRVVASGDRWERRLHGLVHECRLQQAEVARTEPDSPKVEHLQRKIDDVLSLAAFAVPIVRALAEWPVQATWAEWLDRLDRLAPRVLRRPDRVLRVLADLRPMSAIGPVTLPEAVVVLADRLASIELDPPPRRYGRVLVASPAQLRGRSFDVVFVPALAERQFPQKPREDPLLLDGSRGDLQADLLMQSERAELERLQLRLAVGAAGSRLYVSFPTIEIGEGRPRVPSLYALEIWRAMTGRVPTAEELQQAAARTSEATLSWPAPPERRDAIDALEHDLATLRALALEPDDRSRGRAQYILRLNTCLQRSVRERYMRGRKAWSRWDGIVSATERVAPILATHRLNARRYSLSALQKYSICPYQFLLSTIHRLRPADDLEPLQRMDPLTRGSLFHEMQTAFYRRLQRERALPVTPDTRDAALLALDEVVQEIAEREYEELSPAVDRIWHDEIGAIRRDLRLWVDEISRGAEWVPLKFEWAFGYSDGGALAVGRDPTSRPEPVVLDGRFHLHGAIDLVEEHARTRELRVTDHKTGKYRGKDNMIVDGGKVLQPVLYSLALEQALARPVVAGRLYYATTVGGYRDVTIPLSPAARKLGLEVLEIIDRGIEHGFFGPAPSDKACTWCDFLAVCGTGAEYKANRKSPAPLADLLELRRKP